MDNKKEIIYNDSKFSANLRLLIIALLDFALFSASYVLAGMDSAKGILTGAYSQIARDFN